MEEIKTLNVENEWDEARGSWHNPSVPKVITEEELEKIPDKVRAVLAGELAFMAYPEFQTYANLERIISTFKEDPRRGVRAVFKHEIGHRLCPYDTPTMILLQHAVRKALEGKEMPVDKKTAEGAILNLYTDMCINTRRSINGDDDIPWAYAQLSRQRDDDRFWKVYTRSMELAWDRKLLPKDVKLENGEQEAAQRLAELFEGDFFDRRKWGERIRTYTEIISDFFDKPKSEKGREGKKGEKEGGNGGQDSAGHAGITGFDDITANIPAHIDDKTAGELAKRVAEIGSDGMPRTPSGLEDFKEIMAGFGRGDAQDASIMFYDALSNAYDVMFATQPFGRPRTNPFQPVKWVPSMGVGKLDIDYSMQVGGRPIPSVNTYTWQMRKRQVYGGLEEVVPDLDVFIDSSGSMPNPVVQISVPVLAGFVTSKKAHRKGAKVRGTTFSAEGQYETSGLTRELGNVFKPLVRYYGGGTYFPTNLLLEGTVPRQVLIITDTGLANAAETAETIYEFRQKHKQNRVTVYATCDFADEGYLRNAGAEVIKDSTTNIFKRAIGKANEVYSR